MKNKEENISKEKVLINKESIKKSTEKKQSLLSFLDEGLYQKLKSCEVKD